LGGSVSPPIRQPIEVEGLLAEPVRATQVRDLPLLVGFLEETDEDGSRDISRRLGLHWLSLAFRKRGHELSAEVCLCFPSSRAGTLPSGWTARYSGRFIASLNISTVSSR
jgi:hypothetical protein